MKINNQDKSRLETPDKKQNCPDVIPLSEKSYIREILHGHGLNHSLICHVISLFDNKEKETLKKLQEDVENLQKDYANLDICDKEDVINLIKKRFGEMK